MQAAAANAGYLPLITDHREMTPAQLKERVADLKGPMAIAPVFLNDATHIEGLLCLEFRALLERKIRQPMQRRLLEEHFLYPEDRGYRARTATRVLVILSGLSRHPLFQADCLAQVFPPTLTLLQRELLDVIGIFEACYNAWPDQTHPAPGGGKKSSRK